MSSPFDTGFVKQDVAVQQRLYRYSVTVHICVLSSFILSHVYVVWFRPADQKVSVLSGIIERMPRVYRTNLR